MSKVPAGSSAVTVILLVPPVGGSWKGSAATSRMVGATFLTVTGVLPVVIPPSPSFTSTTTLTVLVPSGKLQLVDGSIWGAYVEGAVTIAVEPVS